MGKLQLRFDIALLRLRAQRRYLLRTAGECGRRIFRQGNARKPEIAR